jgi:arginine exporter protein ArgO
MENVVKPKLEIGEVVKARDCNKVLAELGDIYYCLIVKIIEPDVYLAKVGMYLPVGAGYTMHAKLVYQHGGWVWY